MPVVFRDLTQDLCGTSSLTPVLILQERSTGLGHSSRKHQAKGGPGFVQEKGQAGKLFNLASFEHYRNRKKRRALGEYSHSR